MSRKQQTRTNTTTTTTICNDDPCQVGKEVVHLDRDEYLKPLASVSTTKAVIISFQNLIILVDCYPLASLPPHTHSHTNSFSTPLASTSPISHGEMEPTLSAFS